MGGGKKSQLAYRPGTKPAPVYPDNGLPWLDVLSYGGGVDSFTMLVKACELDTPPDVVVFADVGDPHGRDPGEWPGTYRHLREVVLPFCTHFKIPFAWLTTDDYPIRGAGADDEKGLPAHPAPYRSLYEKLADRRMITLTVNRNCTRWAKTERIDQFLEDRYPGHNISMWVGFEAGEESRLAADPYAKDYAGGRPVPRERAEGRKGAAGPLPGTLRANRYPLMEWDFCRCRSERYLAKKNLYIPRKSACVFCGFNRAEDWPNLFVQLPKVFDKVARLEDDVALTEDGVKNRWRATVRREWIDPDDHSKGKVPWPRGKPNGPSIREYVEWKLAGGGKTPSAGTCEVCGGPRAEKEPGCDFMPGPSVPEEP